MLLRGLQVLPDEENAAANGAGIAHHLRDVLRRFTQSYHDARFRNESRFNAQSKDIQ